MKIEITNDENENEKEEKEQPQDRIMKRNEVAALFGVSARAIDKLAKEGTLRRIVFPNRTRSGGFLKSEVMQVLNNK